MTFEHKKSLGQNFLVNQKKAQEIVHIANILEDDVVIEVGPGDGALTNLIAKTKAKKIILIEKDARLIANLSGICENDKRFLIINEDALKVNYEKLLGGARAKIIANLPYYIATELFFNWLENMQLFSRMLLMFQKEVAMRIVAKPNTKEYGKLSVIAQLLCNAEIVLNLTPKDFFPSPKVDSAVIIANSKQETISKIELDNVKKLCNLIFSNRRKQLGTTFKNNFAFLQKMQSLNISGNLRPENLTISQIKSLAN